MSDALFDAGPLTVYETSVALSAGQRRTVKARATIEAGKHPANGLPIDTTHTCGDCVNLNRYHYRSRTYLKCEFHRLGESHSEASDMRASWPACPHWEASRGA